MNARVLRGRNAALPVVALFSVLSCSKKEGGGDAAAFTPPPMPVETAVVTSTTVSDTFAAVGSVQAGEAITVAAEIDGRVVSLPFDEGQSVAKGEVLAQLDASQLRAEVARAQAVLAQRRSTLERTRTLAAQEILAAQSLDDAVAAVGVAEAELALARARLQKTTIVAPWGGVTGTRLVSPGAFIRAGDSITELAAIDEVKVSFSTPERLLTELAPGREVSVTTPAHPDREFTGRVSLVDPMIDVATRSAKLLAVVDNSEGLLRPGMSANVSVVLAERPTALTIPAEAVFAEGNQSLVYVVNDDGSVARTAITMGTRLADSVEIVGGLSAGQRVVRSGHQKLFEGAKVMAVDDAQTRAAGAAPATTAGTP